MLQLQEKISKVNSDTSIIGMFMQITGCNCSCASCQGCVDCVYCANLSLADIVMNVYRKGVKPEPSYFVQYPAHQVGGPDPYGDPYPGNRVLFFIDSILNAAAPGYYVGDVVVRGFPCGSVQLQVGDNNTVFSPFVY